MVGNDASVEALLGGIGGSHRPGVRFGVMRATVVDNADPAKRARVQVRIPALHGTSSTGQEFLPWAEPCFPLAGAPQVGQVFVPPIDATVWVTFENGHASSPVYIGGWWGATELPSEVVHPDKQRVIKTPLGHVVVLDDAAEGKITILHADGSRRFLLDGVAKTIVIENMPGQVITLDELAHTIVVKNADGQTITLDNPAQSVTVVNGAQTFQMDDAAQVIQAAQGAQTLQMSAAAQIIQASQGQQQIIMNAASQTVSAINGVQSIIMNALTLTLTLMNGPTQSLTFNGLTQTAILVNFLVTMTIQGLLGLVNVLAANKIQLHTQIPDGIELGTQAASEAFGIVLGEFKSKYDVHTHSGVTAGGDVTGPPDQAMVVGVDISTIVKAQAAP